MRRLLAALAIVVSACAANPKPAPPPAHPKQIGNPPTVSVQKSVTFEQSRIDRQRANTRVIDRLTGLMNESFEQGPLTAANNLRVRTDANGYMMASAQVYTSPNGPLTNFANLRLRTDANGYLMVVVAGGTCSLTALGTTSTDCYVAQNTTASTVGTTVQISPRYRMRGTGWDTDDVVSRTVDFFTETLPVTGNTVTGQWKLGYSLDGGTISYPIIVSSTGTLFVSGFGSATAPAITIGDNRNGFFMTDTAHWYWVDTNTPRHLIASTGVYTASDRNFGWNNGTDVSVGSIDLDFRRIGTGQLAIVTAANGTTGVGVDAATASTLKVKTADHTAYGTVDSGLYSNYGVPQIYYTTGNFTTAANTNLQTITGLTIPLPATTVIKMPFTCKLTYSIATAAVAMSFGLQTDTLTPTNFQGMGQMETALTTTAYGDAKVTNTTSTTIITGTPSAITTIWNAYLDGFIENPSGAATNINVMVATSNAADLVTVYRDSWCRAF